MPGFGLSIETTIHYKTLGNVLEEHSPATSWIGKTDVISKDTAGIMSPLAHS